MSRWFRHYAGMMRDEKLVSAAMRSKQPIERVLWVYGAILESAAEINYHGKFALDTAEAAYFLRADQADLDNIVRALEELGRLDGQRVVQWGKRQFASDRSAERQRAYRERGGKSQDNQTDRTVTQDAGDGDVTSPSRHGDAPETETYTESEKKEDCSLRSPPPDDWPPGYREVFWSEYPRKVGKLGALKALETVRKRQAVPWVRLIEAVRAYAATADPQFTKHPKTWLLNGCWDDEIQKKPSALATLPIITPSSPTWNVWKAHYRDTGQNFKASLMDKAASDGKPYTVPTELPPGGVSA